jgi:hypothetical protein
MTEHGQGAAKEGRQETYAQEGDLERTKARRTFFKDRQATGLAALFCWLGAR